MEHQNDALNFAFWNVLDFSGYGNSPSKISKYPKLVQTKQATKPQKYCWLLSISSKGHLTGM